MASSVYLGPSVGAGASVPAGWSWTTGALTGPANSTIEVDSVTADAATFAGVTVTGNVTFVDPNELADSSLQMVDVDGGSSSMLRLNVTNTTNWGFVVNASDQNNAGFLAWFNTVVVPAGYYGVVLGSDGGLTIGNPDQPDAGLFAIQTDTLNGGFFGTSNDREFRLFTNNANDPLKQIKLDTDGTVSLGRLAPMGSILGDLATEQLATPGAPSLTVTGADNSVTYGYKWVAHTANGHTAASVETTTTHGPTALSASDHILSVIDPVPGAAFYSVYRTTGGATQGLIATNLVQTTLDDTAWTVSFDDTGAAASGAAPSTNTTGAAILPMRTPSAANAACVKDTFAFDTDFLYVCTATDTWKRVAIATW